MTVNSELKGLGGWLILVGIGVVIGPFRLMAELGPVYGPIFEKGVWEALTTPGSPAYYPYLGSLIIGEIVYNAIIVAASLYLIYLFFSKHYLFPRLYIAVIAVSLVFIPLDAWLVTTIFPSEPMFDSATTKEFVRSLVVGIIWIPYLLVSERVRLTFVEKMPGKEAPVADELLEAP